MCKRISITLLIFSALLFACSSRETQSPNIEATVQYLARISIEMTSQAQVGQITESSSETQQPEVAPTSEPTQAPPTDAPIQRHRVILFGNGDYCSWTQLEALAFTNGIDLTAIRYTRRNDFYLAIDQPDVALIIYTGYVEGGTSEYENDIMEISQFVNNGGRALIFTEHFRSISNQLFRRLFGISIVEETLIQTEHVFFFNEESLPHYMSGLEVGYTGPEIYHYLATNVEGADTRYIRSDLTGEDRIWYVSYPDRSLTFIIEIRGQRCGLFDDVSIDFGDNEEAALAMLMYLLDR